MTTSTKTPSAMDRAGVRISMPMESTGSGPGRAPILWILVPACVGIAVAGTWPSSHPLLPCLTGVFSAFAAIYLDWNRRSFKDAQLLWAAALTLCSMFLFWSYGSVRMLDKLEWKAALPPREVTMEVCVGNVYKSDKYGYQRGIARIVSAPQIQRYLVGQQVIYRMKGDITAQEGATLRVKGIIQREPLEAEPGSFDSWLERREVYFELRRAHIIEQTAPPSRYVTTTLAVRDWMRERLLEGSDKLPYIRAMVPAMMLGEKNLLSPDDKALFKDTGMMHLFAVSGLHVGLVALTIEALFATLRLPRKPRILSAQAVLLGYVWVIGAPPSAVRAFLMILFHRLAKLNGRPSRGLPSLAVSALAVLIWDPRQLFDIGAQLSYGIVAGIMLYGLPMAKLLKEKMPLYEDLPVVNHTFAHRSMIKSRNWLCDAVAATLGAFLISVPLSIQYFGNFAPGSILLNLMMIPLALLSATAAVITIIFSGAAVLPGLGFLAYAGVFVNHAGWLCAWEMQGIIDVVHRIPWLFFKIGFPAPWLGGTITVAMLVLMVLLRHKKQGANITWMLAPVAALACVVIVCVFPG